MPSKQQGKFNKQQGSFDIEDDSVKESHQKFRKEALLQASRDSGYTIAGNGYNVNVKIDRKNAYKELESLQKSAIAQYSKWANEDIKYSALDSDSASKNLKQYNDTYTMAMLMGAISPLERGVDLGSVLQCMISYNIIRTLNPNMDMDSSRMYYNFRNTIAPMIADLSIDHPIAGKLLSNTILKSVDRTLSTAGGARFATTIDAHEKVHDIDSMYLTPRQVAALKINFMEQYYSDLRSTNDDYRRRDFTDKYSKAMKHLETICKNGGYDMSVVAAEERYLVGLKMEQNPKYVTMFAETWDVFGVKMDQNAVNETKRWSGQFIRTDEHEWFGDKNITTNGAFHVRMPMVLGTFEDTGDKKDKDKSLRSQLLQHANSFDEMRAYVDSPMFTGSDEDRDLLLDEIKKNEKEYLKRVEVIIQTDGITDHGKPISVDQEYANALEKSRESERFNNYSEDFAEELDSVVLDKVATRMGYNSKAMRDNTRHKFDISSDEYVRMLSGLTQYSVNMRKKDPSYPEDPDVILHNIQNHYFEDLSPAEQYNILAHTVTNVEQGYHEHQSNRNGYSSAHANRLLELSELTFDDRTPESESSKSESSFDVPDI